jgi:uncharacterized membrane-anchored protein YitT (DUF2179 family)
MKKKLRVVLWEYLQLTLGPAIVAIGLVAFLEPYTIAPGGVTGIAILIKKTTGFPMDITNIVINGPLFIAGLILLGKRFGIKTGYATLALSVFIRIFTQFISMDVLLLEDVLLAAIYGGAFVGIGLGLVFRVGGSTGGTDLAGAILNKFIPRLSTPKMMMVIDLIIVVISGVVNRSLETALYSVITLFLVTKIADLMLEGLSYAKEFIIFSDKYNEIGEAVLNNLGRGVTVLKGQGFYTKEDKSVLLCIVNRDEIHKMKAIIKQIDGDAFVRVATVHEVMGEGFTDE